MCDHRAIYIFTFRVYFPIKVILRDSDVIVLSRVSVLFMVC